ncbi:hypothetical protein [Roseomonas sp. WA12]
MNSIPRSETAGRELRHGGFLAGDAVTAPTPQGRNAAILVAPSPPMTSARKPALRPTRDILAVGALGLLLAGCVPPPAYYYDNAPAYAPYGRAPAPQSYTLPPPVPPGGYAIQPSYEAAPGYRSYGPPPGYPPEDGRLGRGQDYGAQEDPRQQPWPPGGPGGWNAGYGREDAPAYRQDEGAAYPRPLRNRLDDPEPDGTPYGRPYGSGDEPREEPGRAGGGPSGLGQPVWR